MKKNRPTTHYLKDLDHLYDLALGKENLTAAIKIKEMQERYREENTFDLKDLSDDQLDHLIQVIEDKIKNENAQK